MIHVAIPGVYNFGRGASVFVLRISMFFHKGIVFDYIAYKNPHDMKYVDQINNTGGSVVLLTQCRIPILRMAFSFFYLLRYLKEKKYEICYINASNAIEMFGQAFAAYIAGIPIRIGHSHSSGVDFTGIKRLIRIIFHWIFKPFLSLVLTDYLSCSDKASTWMYTKTILQNDKVVYIKNPVDTEKYQYSPEMQYEKKMSMNLSNSFVIGHIGRFTYTKNHAFILLVFKEILKLRENSFLFLIGDGPLYDRIKIKAKKLGIIDNVLFNSPTSYINEFMQTFDAFLLPSFFEGFPLVGIEAQSTGLPCFFSDTISRQVNVTGNCFYLSLKDKPGMWAEKIVNITETFRRENGIDIIKKAGFDVRQSAEELEEYFLKQIKNKNLRRIKKDETYNNIWDF